VTSFSRQLTDIQYQRNDIDFHRGTFRVRGDVVDVYPAGEEWAYRIDMFGDEVERITRIDPLTGEIMANLSTVTKSSPAATMLLRKTNLRLP
jgi:excinuclease ABC subunit B